MVTVNVPIEKYFLNPPSYGGNGKDIVGDDRHWVTVGYRKEERVVKRNKGAMSAFKKLVEFGYKPETGEDAEAFVYLAEKLKEIMAAEKRRLAEIKAWQKAEREREEAERKAAQAKQDALDAAKKSIWQKISDDTKLQDIVADIKQMDQETINYLASNMAEDHDAWRPNNTNSDNKVKALAVSLTVYDRSTGAAKNMLKSELLKMRIGHYKEKNRKETLDLFQKANKMLSGEIKEDVIVKGLTRRSYTPFSSLNKALKEVNKNR